MEIKKGYTRSQFIKLIKNRKYQNYLKFYNSFEEFSINNLGLIYRFDTLCDQPLKKEMFVNEVLHPKTHIFRKDYFDDISFEMGYAAQLSGFEESEKKVIFEGWGSYDKKNPYYFILNHSTSIDFLDDNSIEFDSSIYDKTRYLDIKTIGDLFQATNGELNLKNVEL